MPGKLIAFEGIDGVGKDTQLKLLMEKLKEDGFSYKSTSFPRHGNPAAYFVDRYLSIGSPYGEADKLDAYQSSVFYSLDRYDASFEIRKWLEEVDLVILDRYTGSNIGHQGGKLNEEERAKYVSWLMDFEYNLLKIPRPDFSVILWLPPEVAETRITSRGRAKDGHEADSDHLKRAQASYLWASKYYPEDFKVVKCFEEERELNPQEVHEKVWQVIKGAIKK